jgi:2-amino-4-hydroxy-6-hydroxymethyldihydropteridine diphosphokinase
MPLVYLSLGSNLGDRAAHLQAARTALARRLALRQVSRIYETPPWGYADQPSFLNQVVGAETEMGPEALLIYLKYLEAELGRKPTFRYGPRVIDLDILFYDDLVLETPQLTIPHPRLHERAFVLVPLAEIAPGLRHPRLGLTVAELAARVETTGIAPWSE